jgi:hypothetical protein
VDELVLVDNSLDPIVGKDVRYVDKDSHGFLDKDVYGFVDKGPYEIGDKKGSSRLGGKSSYLTGSEDKE